METVTVSRRNHTNRKQNKENAQPAFGGKPIIKKEKSSAHPFQPQSNKKEETLQRSGPLKAKDKQVDTRSTSGEALKKTVQRNVNGAAVTLVKKRQTHSQAFLSEQAVKHKKMVAEAPKPPAAVLSSKPAPGMYKGKIVQSKIGSIWKSSSSLAEADPKPLAPKTASQRPTNVMKVRSKSVTDTLRNGAPKPAPARSKSVSEKPAEVFKLPAPTGRPPAKFSSARPPARTIPTTLTSTSTRNTKAAPNKGGQMSKPKVSVTDRKVNKPPVSSTISQYRLNMESAEERRAKLADWLASKGKTFKRPAMTMATVQPKTKVPVKSEGRPKPQSQTHMETQRVKEVTPEPVTGQAAQNLFPAAAACAETQSSEVTAQSQTPAIMNTTLDLLENSDNVFDVQQDEVQEIVVNLCDALEAMSTPSMCSDEVSGEMEVCIEVTFEKRNEEEESVEEQKDERVKDEEEELKTERPEDVSKQLKDEEEESEEEEVEMKDDAEEEAESDEGVMETTPQKDASVVKYSVRTTPYLQSVKKTIEGEASSSTSRRKSNIKDLKFLTPVRRSCRIERKSSRMPTMLVDHDPCVSSLAELVKLDDDPNAYIYRKNPALLEDLPDQPRV